MLIMQKARAHLWLIHTARQRDLDRYRERNREQWIPMYYTEMFTLVRDRKELGPIVSYYVNPVPCTCPGPIPMQCEQAIILSLLITDFSNLYSYSH